MQRNRQVLDTAGASAAAAVACLALIVPAENGCGSAGSALQTTLLTITVPRATAAGAVVAVLAAVCVSIFSPRVAWGTAAVAALLLTTDHLLVAATPSSLTTANFVDSISAGVLLGAAGAAALEYRPPAIGYLAGALTGLAVGNHLEFSATAQSSRSILERAFNDLPPNWLSIPTIGLLAVCCLIRRRPVEAYPTTLNLPFGPVLAAAIVITTITVVSERLEPAGAGAAAIVAGVLATLAAAVLAALLMPGRDGTLILLAVALAGTGSAIAVGAQAHWKLVPMLIAVLAGLAAGLLRPVPAAAIGGALALGLFALLGPTVPQDDSWPTLIGSCAIAALAGYGFGAFRTRTAPGIVLPLGILLLPSAVLTLEYHSCATASVRTENITGNRTGWAGLALAVGSVLAILALRRRRSEPGT
ncbi:hypothetical protein NS506_05649 [Nocardia seriolae]|uniref:Uncharacterized protein n=1 Tax=Nocardia seriolae TaxID=37332 RepID=A0ABC8B094_9NOCA|nr:hypothetical protein [Nocardia seriolae]APA99695.1 hypothetical protein NS506_05649 [Nocardia seriolae]